MAHYALMHAKASVWLFKRLYSLTAAFETVVPLVLTILSLGLICKERHFLRALGVCLEQLLEFAFHEEFRGKEIELGRGDLLCEVRGVQLDFEWFTPIRVRCLCLGALETFVVAVFAFVIYEFVSLLISRRFLLEAFLIAQFVLVAYFSFDILLSRGRQSIGFVEWSFFESLLRRSLDESIEVGLGGTTPRALLSIVRGCEWHHEWVRGCECTHPLVWDLTPILFSLLMWFTPRPGIFCEKPSEVFLVVDIWGLSWYP